MQYNCLCIGIILSQTKRDLFSSILTDYVTDMPILGPYSNCATLAKLDGRTKEARLVKSLRDELTAHVGGSPSTTQRLLIDQAVQLQLRLSLMDKDGGRTGEMTERNQVQYLAWSGALTRLLRQLGLNAAPKPAPTLAAIDWSASRARPGVAA